MAHGDERAGEGAPAESGVASEPIDQVRELLFGAPKRETIDRIRVLEDRLAEMRADFIARLDDIETRMSALARDSDERQAAAYHAIGGAIAQLGASIQDAARRRDG